MLGGDCGGGECGGFGVVLFVWGLGELCCWLYYCFVCVVVDVVIWCGGKVVDVCGVIELLWEEG